MIIVIKNFKRNKFVNLTIKSIRYFCPGIPIFCLNMFKTSFSEYDHLDKIDLPDSNIFYRRSRYTDLGPSVANQYNNLFFSEGYNYIWEHFKDYDDKILMLAEDHFFTNGQTLKELIDADYDIAYAAWNQGCNGSILAFNPVKIRYAFPIPEDKTTVEHTFKNWIMGTVNSPRTHILSTRDEENYKGDGLYTNAHEEVEKCMREAGIL